MRIGVEAKLDAGLRGRMGRQEGLVRKGPPETKGSGLTTE